MLIKEIMTKDVVKVAFNKTLSEAITLMKEKNLKSMIVDKAHAHDTYGILTQTDILKAVVNNQGNIDLLHVYDVYQKPVITMFG